MSKDTKIKDTKKVIIDDLFGTELGDKCFVSIRSEGAIPKSKEYIPLLADESCVKPCMLLYDMGIRTMNSGANVDGKSNASGYGFIGIDYNSLSDENKIIPDTLAERGIINPVNKIVGSHGKGILTLKTPLTSETTVGEVERKLIELVNLFQPQDVLYGRKTIEDIKSQYRDNGDGTYYSDFLHGNVTREEMESFIEEDMEELQKMFYDEEKYYYLTEELLNIHLNYIKQNKINMETESKQI